MVDPSIILGAATAGGGLLQGLLQAQQAEEDRKLSIAMAEENARQQAIRDQMSMAQNQATNQQNALANLVNIFRGAYL